MSARRPGDVVPRNVRIGDRVGPVFIGVVASLLAIPVLVVLVLLVTGPWTSFQTLRADLSRVRFPPGYHLVSVRRSGTDCAHASCSLTETWTSPGSCGRTVSGACSDVRHAMTAAYPQEVSVHSPMAAGSACHYDALPASEPGQGKPVVVAIVRADQTDPAGVVVRLTGAYGP